MHLKCLALGHSYLESMTEDSFVKDYPIDFGSGVRGIWYSYKGTEHAGLIVAHKHADGGICAGSVPIEGRNFLGNREMWRLLSEDPLTLDPSIDGTKDNPDCNLHGHIQNGKWVGPA